jgi:uncharacterized protein YndB with AHSA1/START domain
MDQQGSSTGGEQNRRAVARSGDRELVITRLFKAPRSTVYAAWSQPELFRRWWMPESASGVALVLCEMDVRTGGTYRLGFGTDGSAMMTFHGKYLSVTPDQQIVWTNDEADDGAVTTVTFEDQDEGTAVTFREIYSSTEALEQALQGSALALPEQLEQLDKLLSGMAG